MLAPIATSENLICLDMLLFCTTQQQTGANSGRFHISTSHQSRRIHIKPRLFKYQLQGFVVAVRNCRIGWRGTVLLESNGEGRGAAIDVLGLWNMGEFQTGLDGSILKIS